MEWHEDWDDDSVIEFLNMMYITHLKYDNNFTMSRKDFYKEFYSELKAFKDGEW